MTKERSDLLYMLERPLGRAAVLPCSKDTHYPHLEGTKKLVIFKLPKSCLFQPKMLTPLWLTSPAFGEIPGTLHN